MFFVLPLLFPRVHVQENALIFSDEERKKHLLISNSVHEYIEKLLIYVISIHVFALYPNKDKMLKLVMV
jgi:hypothetical protein